MFSIREIPRKQLRKQPILSSHVGESSIINTFEKIKQAKVVAARLQFLRDALCENAFFSDMAISVHPPCGDSNISIFEGCSVRNHRKSIFNRSAHSAGRVIYRLQTVTERQVVLCFCH